MTYTRATLAEFQAVFSGFGDVTEDQYAYWAARAERVIDSEFGDDQAHGTMLLTAHYLTLQGLGTGVESERASNFGGATRVKSGSLELSWSDGGSSSAVGGTGSRYGDEVKALIWTYKGGPGVAGTGTWPVAPAYGPY